MPWVLPRGWPPTPKVSLSCMKGLRRDIYLVALAMTRGFLCQPQGALFWLEQLSVHPPIPFSKGAHGDGKACV